MTAIEEPSDPSQVYALRDRLCTIGILYDEEIEAFAGIFFRQKGSARSGSG